MNNYLEFLLDLWKITKDDGGFKAFSPLISKHKVNTSSSVILRDELQWVITGQSDTGSNIYVWNEYKPTKNDAIILQDHIKQRILDKKESTKKKTGKEISKKSKQSKVLYTSDNTTENEIKNDVKEVLENTINDITKETAVKNLKDLTVYFDTYKTTTDSEIEGLKYQFKMASDSIATLEREKKELKDHLDAQTVLSTKLSEDNFKLIQDINIQSVKLNNTINNYDILIKSKNDELELNKKWYSDLNQEFNKISSTNHELIKTIEDKNNEIIILSQKPFNKIKSWLKKD